MKKILLTLLTASMLITGCTSVTKSGVVGADRKQFMLVSSEAMEQSSAQAYVKTLTAARSKGELNVDPILTKRVQDIAKKLIAQTGVFREDALKWKWQVNVINEDTLNAWCMPGGRIVVYSGIIKKLNLTDAQLAAVMGHEIAHALREHSREQASTDQLKNIGIFAVATATGLGDLGASALGLATQYTISMPFSRSHETEADHIGTELMARAGYDPKEAVEVWVKMSKMNVGKVPEILSTHPSNESRIKDLKEVAAKLEPVYQAAKKG
ncbi:M48 family metallopeptidase [Campylobacter concisus]|uniref:M48 family metallopeptidase n=1 Tax=Campylobacter concisus TaxID=199 RepID=UPI00188409A1|nr:M48 family metallopeptidase [Campylobacter concisus]MBE9863297.1 M48 family metallopeptidase [Campylobacter concisus]